jgi:two-component system phosphate regulon response regulator PhoB
VREMIVFVLREAGYTTMEARDAEVARAIILKHSPDLILMDWMLPGSTDGIELTRELKRHGTAHDIPVIMLTARGGEDDKVQGLECGAEDYITKPFSPRELRARINAILGRLAPHTTDESVQVGALRLEPLSYRVTARGEYLNLAPTEFRLLRFFMTHLDRAYSRGMLLDLVWGANVYIEERTIDVHIRRLRMALKSHGIDAYVQTVRGAGYRFTGPPRNS